MQSKINRGIQIIICLLLIHQTTSAQFTGSGIGSWNILNLKYTHTPQLSFFGEAQLRSLAFYDRFHYYEFKGGVNYKVLPNLKLSLGAGTYQTYREGGNFVKPKNNDEFRLWPQLTLFQDIRKLKVEQRFRTEMRWTSNGYRNRFRYRLAVSHPFGRGEGKSKPFLAPYNLATCINSITASMTKLEETFWSLDSILSLPASVLLLLVLILN